MENVEQTGQELRCCGFASITPFRLLLVEVQNIGICGTKNVFLNIWSHCCVRIEKLNDSTPLRSLPGDNFYNYRGQRGRYVSSNSPSTLPVQNSSMTS